MIERTRNEHFTKDDAAALIKERVNEMVELLNYSESDARHIVLQNLGYAAGHYSHEIAERVFDVYGTEHPIYGRNRPNPAEAIQMEIAAEKRKKEKLIDNQES